MTSARVFPSLVNHLAGNTWDAWQGLGSYHRPFLTIWGGNDPGILGGHEVADRLINHIPGAKNQKHVRLPQASHFLQDDQGAEIARLMIQFIKENP